MRYKLGSTSPLVDESTFIAPGAHVIGNVELKVGSSVWFNAVIRGDMDKITVGENTNIQDGSVLHTDAGIPLVLGEGVTVGHKVMLTTCLRLNYRHFLNSKQWKLASIEVKAGI